jgi:Ca2+-binding RTX toxin-like protein
MATINHSSGADIIVPSNNGTTYRGLAGDDTYIISNGIAANAAITIVDTSGANKIQLVDGLSIASSKFAADAVQLTLSNGAVVTINGASNFSYDVGGNATSGTSGSSNTLTQLASSMGVATLPSSGSVAGSSNVSVSGNGVSSSAAPSYTVTKSASSVDEGNSVTFTITASAAVSSDTNFSWTVIGDNNGTTVDKASTTDVDVLSGSATIASGSSSTTFAVTATSDAIVEGVEGIKVSVFDSNSVALSSNVILVNNSGSSATSQSFTLTTGVNEFTGGSGNDSFDASLNTGSLNDFDVIDGQGGTDTLTSKLSLDGGGSIIPQISNIEKLQITNIDGTTVAGADVVTINLAAITGLTTLMNTTSADGVTFADVENIVDVELKSAVGTTTVDYQIAALSGTADNQLVTIKGTNGTTLIFTDNDTTQTAGSLETVTINSLSVTNTLDDLQTTSVGASNIVVTGNKLLILSVATDAEVISIDSSATSGGLTLTEAPGFANATITGGSGPETGLAPIGNANISGGAGNDSFDFAATYNALDVYDGGDGVDTVKMTTGWTNNSVVGGLSNVEIITISTAETVTLTAAVPGVTTYNFSADDDQILNLLDGYVGDVNVLIRGDDTNADSVVNTANVSLNISGNVEDFDGSGDSTFTGGAGTDTLTMRNTTDGATAVLAGNITGIDAIVLQDFTAGADATITTGAYTLDSTFVKSMSVDASTLDVGEDLTFGGASSVTRMDITSGAGADAITLGTVGDTVDAGLGNDTVVGTSGGNNISLGGGNDSLTAGTGNEVVDGGAGNDTFNLAGNLNAGDSINGGDGVDTLLISTGIATASVLGGSSNLEILTVTGVNTITANGNLGGANIFNLSDDANQTLTLTSAAAGGTYDQAVTVYLSFGAAHDDTNADVITNSKGVALNVIGDADTFDANTTITGSATAVDTLTVIADADGTGATFAAATYIDKVIVQDSATAGEDVVITPRATDATTPLLTIDATQLDAGTGAAMETLTLTGTSVTVTKLNVTGGGGNDSLYGGQKNDTIEGGVGIDSINGNEGADSLSGGAGNDIFLVDALSDHYTAALGSDTIQGGAGTDTITWTGAITAPAVSLATIYDTESWTFANDSSITLSDTVVANNPNLNIAIAGNGTITTGESATGTSLMSSALTISSTSAGNLNLITSSGDDTFKFYATENLTAEDSIDGNAGSDTIQITNDDNKDTTGDATTAAFGASVKGIETILIVDGAVDQNAGDVTINIADGYTDAALTVDGSALDNNSITLANGETLTVSSLDTNVALTIIGGASHDSLTTNAGADNITGGFGNDTISSGDGKDTIYGGAGIDNIKGQGSVDFIDAGAGNDIIEVSTSANFKTSGGVETVYGGSGKDTLKFSEQADVTITAPEVEHLYGIEQIQFANGGNAAKITFGNATFTNNGPVITVIGTVTASGTNFVDASAVTNGAIVVSGNIITGNNDSLYGGSGTDTFSFSGTAGLEDGDIINGNAGIDTINLNNDAAVTAVIDFKDVTNVETIKTSTVDGTASGNVNIQLIDGTTDALDPATLTADFSASNVGSVIFNNATPIDTLKTDMTITGGTAADTIKGSKGNDTISGGGTTTGDKLYGQSGNDSITGNSGADSIIGGAGNDVMLSGAAGNDTIDGGAGNDTIDGGAGVDVITGSAGSDNITLGTSNDLVTYDAATESTGATKDVYTDFTQSVVNATTGNQVSAGDSIRITVTMTNDNNVFDLSDKGNVTSTGLAASQVSGVQGNFVFAQDTDTLFIDIDGNGALNGSDYQIVFTGFDDFVDDDLDIYVTAGTGGDKVTTGDGDDSLTGNSGADTLIAGRGNDVITHGSNGANKFVGGLGSDTITGGSATEAIWADNELVNDVNPLGGNDVVVTGASNSTVYGGFGNDNVTGGAGVDKIYGESGNDTIIGAANADTLIGGAGNDVITDAAGASSIEGGAGNDTIVGGADNNTIKGGAGNDTITGGTGVESIYGDAGNDTIISGDGADKIDGGAGNDKITDAAGAGSLTGGTGDDTLIGGADNNTIKGGDGQDVITGGSGAESLYGDAGNDTVISAAGVDSAYGGAGNDIITDAAGASKLFGGAGDDTLIGGAGVDTYTGDAGNDTFNLVDALVVANKASIADFVIADDTIIITAAYTTVATAAGSQAVITTAAGATIANGAPYVPGGTVTADTDILFLPAAELPGLNNSESIAAPAELLEALVAQDTNNHTASGITTAANGHKFYILAYQNNDVFLYTADPGASNNLVAASEINLVMHITGPDTAVGALTAADFIMG